MNNRIESLVIAVIVAVIGIGGAAIVVDIPEELNQQTIVDQVLEDIVVEDGIQGPRGYTGTAGVVGQEGPVGPAGADGVDGKDAVVDLDNLADEVADILEDRDDGEVFTLRCGEGETTHQFEVSDDGTYRFEFRNYNSGDFDLFLTDEDGDDRDIMSGSGNRTKTSTLTLNDNELYTVTINAEGSCKLTVEEN